MHKGEIICMKLFSASCGLCEDKADKDNTMCEPLEEYAGLIAEFVRILEGFGWKKIKRHGWVCLKCQEELKGV